MPVYAEYFRLALLTCCLAGCAAAQPDQPALSPRTQVASRQPPIAAAREPAPSGGLKPQQIARVVTSAHPEISACYALSPASAEGLSGTITIAWEMTPLGEVSEIAVHETQFEDQGLVDCLLEKLKQLRYAVASQPTRASWTFRFEP